MWTEAVWEVLGPHFWKVGHTCMYENSSEVDDIDGARN